MEISLSIIVPAYNEALRIEQTLEEIVSYCNRQGLTYEVIVVDDGSADNTADVVSNFSAQNQQVRLINVVPNRGKGNAVRTGAEHALGAVILFTDADGSTPFAEYARLAQALEQGADIAIGSRGLGSAETKVEALWYRKIIGRVFNFLVNTFLVPGITDTQCGFKCFKRNAAEFVFTRQTAERFSFDVELLFLARKGNFIVREIPVNWHNVEGSKVNLITDSARMFIDLLLFIVKDLRGCYRK